MKRFLFCVALITSACCNHTPLIQRGDLLAKSLHNQSLRAVKQTMRLQEAGAALEAEVRSAVIRAEADKLLIEDWELAKKEAQ